MLRASPRLVRRRKRALWGAFFLVSVAAAGWAVFFTQLFTVRNVALAVYSRSTIPIERIKEVVGDLKSRRANILFLSQRGLERRLMGAFPELRSVSVERTILGLPFLSKRPGLRRARLAEAPAKRAEVASATQAGLINEVSIVLQERDPVGTVCRGPEGDLGCFLFDREGILFTRATSSAPYILDTRNVEHRLRYQIFSAETASRFAETVSQTIVGLRAARLEFGDSETRFVTPEGWGIILSNERPPGEQFEAARIVLEREIGPRRAELEYIDTTIKNRVYYRYRSK